MKRSPFGAGLKGVTAMELGIYRYDMENAYSAGKGTKRADMILSAARYIMKDDRRYETMNRSVSRIFWRTWLTTTGSSLCWNGLEPDCFLIFPKIMLALMLIELAVYLT